MISAISNPFLYGYFNETLKDGVRRIFSLCCPRLNRGVNQISFDQSDYFTTKIKAERNSVNNILPSETSYTPLSTLLNNNGKPSLSISRPSHDLSTRLTNLSSNQFSASISSHI